MNTYTINVERESGWWIISVPELESITSHAKSLTHVENVARELIAAWLDTSVDTFSIDINVITPQAVQQLLTNAQELDKRAKSEQAQATQARQEAAKTLLQLGLSTREAAQVMGVSHQRISQLTS